MNLRMMRSFVAELEKLAKLQTTLLPHQQRVVDRLKQDDQPGIIAVHGLGSGKTLTSIAAQDAMGTGANVIVPAALRANYQKERTKHLGDEQQPIHLDSLQNAAVKGSLPSSPMMIVDEAHRARDPGSKTYQALANSDAKKRLLLTGSPFYNHPGDIAPLVNLAANQRIMPSQRDEFSRQYIQTVKKSPGIIGRLRGVKPGEVEQLNPKKKKELQEIFAKWVDYHPGSAEGFPDVTREDVKVPMSREQTQVYDAMMGKAPFWFSHKVKKGLPPSKQESKDLNAFAGAVRQVANTTGAHQPGRPAEMPKIQEAFRRLQEHHAANPNARSVVYSNYLDAGVNPYKKLLEGAGMPYGEFTGSVNARDRDRMVNEYNEGKLKTLLLSGAGGEGLDLKGTSLMQLLEPHWNLERLKQVEGRGARYKSHAALPEEERKLKIERYLATRPRMGVAERLHLKAPGGGIDEYLQGLSQSKEDLIQQFRGLLPGAQQPPAAR